MKFNEFGFSESIEKGIRKERYIEATPIQEMCIPHVLNNEDLIGIAQTGTGKTAAFALPILEKLIRGNNENKKIKVLVLSPTRELAIQIRDNFVSYGAFTNYKCSVILGGVNQASQIKVLKKGLDILVATPGRLLDLSNSKKVDLSHVEMLVLDEADTMLDMGFIKDVKQIIKKTPKARQTMLFSATMSKDVDALAKELMNNPVALTPKNVEVTKPKIKQMLYYVDKKHKFDLLLDLFNKEKFRSTLIFTRTKFGADKLEKALNSYNVKSSVIHGNKTQSNRVKALQDFKSGKTNILIATDIAARGIDINDLSHVINYDVPESPEIYVHRIGRTARAGKEGISISFCSSDEVNKLRSVERLIKEKLPVVINDEYSINIETNNFKTASSSYNNGNSTFKKKNTFKKDSNKNNNKGNYKFNSNKKFKKDSLPK